MKILMALSLIAAIVLIMSCQQPAQIKTEMEKQTAQIKSLESKVDALNVKVEQLITDFNKHMDDFHKKSHKPKRFPALGYAPNQ
jgi:uncharacterized protein YoxC